MWRSPVQHLLSLARRPPPCPTSKQPGQIPPTLPGTNLVHGLRHNRKEARLALLNAGLSSVHEHRYRLAQLLLAVALQEHFLKCGQREEGEGQVVIKYEADVEVWGCG